MSGRRSLHVPGTGRRSSGTPRRGPTIRRSSAAGFGRTRALALLVLIASGLAVYGVSASSAFGYRALDVSGANLTDAAAVREAVAVTDGTNLFRLSTDGMVERLRSLPTVAGATVEVALPNTLRVRLEERLPIVVWQIGKRRLLIDADRTAFAPAGDAADLPVVDDRRIVSTALDVGDSIDPVDFDAATRLGSLRPADVGSGAAALGLTVDDEHGFVVDSGTDGWTAIFGFYTPTIRKTDLIAGQVRLLRSLLAGREATVERVILADDRTGTYTLKVAP